MKKFLVLNLAFQPVNPYQFGFKKQEIDEERTPPANAYAQNQHACNLFLLDTEDEAKKFAEFMAGLHIGANQMFHVSEVKGTVRAKVPVAWE